MDQPDRELIAEIARGAKLLFDNAEALYNEAEMLGTSGHFARALCLHQISIEECSKIDMLGAAAAGMVAGHSADLEKLAKAMRSHRIKNFNNAYFSVTTESERAARKSGNLAAARELFRRQQEAIHKELNDNKNAALYVEYMDGHFVAPSERINEALAVQTQQLNAYFLQHGSLHVRLLHRFVEEPDLIEGRMKTILESLQTLQGVAPSELDDRLMEALETMEIRILGEKP